MSRGSHIRTGSRSVKSALQRFGFLSSDFSARILGIGKPVTVRKTGAHDLSSAYGCLVAAGFLISNSDSYELDGFIEVQA